MNRFLMFVYALVAYVIGLGAIACFIGFIGDIAVPKSIMEGPQGPVWLAVVVDSALVLGFGLHHSMTARTSFKRWWTQIVPEPIERATYLLMSAAGTFLLVWFWRPIPITIWQVEAGWAVGAIYAAYGTVWLTMVAATFHFGHFSFMGLTQAFDHLRGAARRSSAFGAQYLYALVRHPISLGWMVAPFLVPHFTVGHGVFAAATIVYVLIATPFEERDLIENLGEDYEAYRGRVPAFLPGRKAS